MNFLALVEDHGWDKTLLLLDRYNSTLYREFDEGFVMVVTDPTGKWDILVATSIDDKHSMDMWRVIRNILNHRKRPIVTQYERNFDKLFKASKRYGGIAYPEGIVVFL